MKTIEQINQHLTISWEGADRFLLKDEVAQTKTELKADDICKMAAVQDHVHGLLGDEVRQVIKFASRVLTNARYAPWGLK